MQLTITIAGNEWGATISSIQIVKQLSGRYSTATFNVQVLDVKEAVTLPQQYDEVIITNTATTDKVFRGMIDSITITQLSGNFQMWQLQAVGLEYLLDNAVITMDWSGVTDRQIIQDTFTAQLPEITTLNATVAQLAVALDFSAKDLTLRQVMDNLCQLTGGEYRITEDKALSYRAAGSVHALFGFSDQPTVV